MTETRMVRAGYTPRHLSKTIHGGWAMPWSAEEMLDGQHQTMGILAHARTAHNDLLQKKGKGSLLNRLSGLLDDSIGRGTELN